MKQIYMRMKNKKILSIITTPYYVPKGSSMRVNSIIEKLSKENVVDVITYPYGEDIEKENLTIHRTIRLGKSSLGVGEVSFRKLLLDFLVFLKAFKFLLTRRYDIVHCEDFEAASIGRFLKYFFRDRKYVYDLHNTIEDNLEIGKRPKALINIAKILSKWIIRGFDMVIINWSMYNDIEAKQKFLLYDEFDIRKESIRLPTRRKYFVYSGNYKKYQGVDDFLKVFKKSNIKHDLVLVGDASEEIHRLVEKLGLNDRVHFMGLLPVTQSNYVISMADYALIPRISGKQPGLKILNHIMLDKVSIASDISANREVLKNRYNGILYSDSESLLNVLNSLSNSGRKDLLRGIKETREKVLKNWDYDYFIKSYSKVLDE